MARPGSPASASAPLPTPQPASADARAQEPSGLYLVPTPIGNLGDLSPRVLRLLAGADLIACEDTRRTGMLLQLTGIGRKRLVCLEAHRESSKLPELLDALERRQIVTLVSDGGTPCLSDPGLKLVQAAVARNIPIISLPGPSAISAGWAASGFPAPWTFYGFIARKGKARRAVFEAIAGREAEGALLFESPFRVIALLKELCEDVKLSKRPLVLAQEISKIHERYHRGTAMELLPALEARPSIKGEWTVMIGPAALDGSADDSALVDGDSE